MKKNTQIFVFALLSVIMLSGIFVSCKKSSVAAPDPIGGFNSSNDIQAAALKAHWTFDGNANESISNTAPKTTVGASFGTGVKGQALNLSNGYLLYPNISALNGPTFASITVSCWVNTANNKTATGGTPSDVFSLSQGTANQTDWNVGTVNMLIETGQIFAGHDTLILHPSIASYINGTPSGGIKFGDNINNGDPAKAGVDYKVVSGASKWTHYVFRYDGTGSNADVFANGVLVSNSNYRQRGTFGPLMTAGGQTQAIIGGFPNSATGFANSAAQVWQTNFTGSIDELRVYNTALTDAEISSLYQLELAGR